MPHRRFFHYITFLCLAVLATFVHSAEKSIHEIEILGKGGAVELALSQFDQYQPVLTDEPIEWLFWERSRISLMSEAGYFQAAEERLESIYPKADQQTKRWILLSRAQLGLQSYQPLTALERLQELVWLHSGLAGEKELPEWRRLIMETYLASGRVGDLRRAINRAEQDYQWNSDAWIRLRVQALLMNKRPHESLEILKQYPKAKIAPELRLLAQLRSRSVSASKAYREAIAAAKEDGIAFRQKANFWFIAAEAAKELKGWDGHLRALEQSGKLSMHARDNSLFTVSAQSLRDAYLPVGQSIANQNHLLAGQVQPWIDKAKALSKEKPAVARALVLAASSIALKTGLEEEHEAAEAQFVAFVVGDKNLGPAFLKFFYMDLGAKTPSEYMPRVAAHYLFEMAVAAGDVESASKLSDRLEIPPNGAGRFDWQLRRARIMVMAGELEQGVTTLDQLLSEHLDANDKQIDMILQVLFDLQAIGEHRAALKRLEQLEQWNLSPKHRREMLYWRAESLQALNQRKEAAVLYLRSATFMDGKGQDQWGQAARYQAAKTLADAGLIADARNIYEQLLEESESAVQRARLRRNIQQLWVSRQKKEAEDPS
ncbi:MAG TPA: hypothetical protein DCZ12_16985 [Gammaproteobacteria bacterium]|nr:hypothetical protein [Gammaproteobacteria bacterium]